jgi:hypothetical protein
MSGFEACLSEAAIDSTSADHCSQIQEKLGVEACHLRERLRSMRRVE